MNTLEHIERTVKADLAQLNDIIATTVCSNSAITNRIVTRYLSTKGKQIRPILVLLSARLFGGVNQAVLNAGAAIELLHNASLIHDDVIDQSKVRRGAPTINSVWDNHVAVLVGDYFVSGALTCADRTQDMRVLASLANMGAELSLGELDQIDNARRRNITEAEYMHVINRKTAALFNSCVEVGALCAGASDGQIEPLKRYAVLFGQCFQIKDDTFDYFDDPVIGKPTGNDLREGKITLPLIYALSRNDLPAHKEMNDLVHKPELSDDDISRLVGFAKQNGGIDYAYGKMEQLASEAYEMLKAYPESDTTHALRAIFNFIITRDK